MVAGFHSSGLLEDIIATVDSRPSRWNPGAARENNATVLHNDRRFMPCDQWNKLLGVLCQLKKKNGELVELTFSYGELPQIKGF